MCRFDSGDSRRRLFGDAGHCPRTIHISRLARLIFHVLRGRSPTRLHVIVMLFAVFCCPKNKHRAIDPPCLDPMDFGVGDEPEPELLMRRGRVGLFRTEDDAKEALQRTGKACSGQPWLKEFAFIVLECCDRSSIDVEA